MSSVLDLVKLIRLRVSIYHNARVCGNWQINEHSQGSTCFHMATQNSCLLVVPGHGRWVLQTGDLVIFPHEIPHRMTPLEPLTGPQEHLPIASSQAMAGTSLICGEVGFEHYASRELLSCLPAVFVIKQADAQEWLPNVFALILGESLSCEEQTNPIINRLCELMFSYALRHFIECHDQDSGLLALLGHAQLSKALSAIHDRPAIDWKLADLAKYVGMSRTGFSQTFKRVSGWTPMQYVTWWRMQLAWSYLCAGDNVAKVAEQVGYGSEAAFSRAFKHQFGRTAGTVRRGEVALLQAPAAL